MALNIWGTEGTVSEVQWANLQAITAQKYTRRESVSPFFTNDLVAIPSYLSVGAGVAVESTEGDDVPLPAGAIVGRWYLLVLRRVWGASPSATHVWLDAGASPILTPEGWPLNLPAARQKTPGVVDDEPVLWYKHKLDNSIPTYVEAGNYRGGQVEELAGLWDPIEQGFSYAVLNPSRGAPGLSGSLRRLPVYVEQNSSWRRIATNDNPAALYRLNLVDREFTLNTSYFQASAATPGWSIQSASGFRVGNQAQITVNAERTGAAITVPANGDIANQAVALFNQSGQSTFGAKLTTPTAPAFVGTLTGGAVSGTAITLTSVAPGTVIGTGAVLQFATGLYQCATDEFSHTLNGYPVQL